MNIAVVGTGYVGLVTGTCFAETGNNVICVDNNEAKVQTLKAGRIPIYEPGLDVLFERNMKEKRLHFTTDLREAVEKSTLIFLALPTPPGEDGSADLSYVLGVARQLAELITDYRVIVNKSTVPVGTAEKVAAILAERLPQERFDVVSNPEFLREGVAVEDFLKPDRVVVGTSSERARRLMKQLYEPFVRQGNPIYFMDTRSAEMTKYAANAYLAMRISFMNEMANLCERTGANVDMVRIGIGSDSRIGKRFLFPGIGYGGSCFPKDVKALARTAEEYDYDFRILKAVMGVNERQRSTLVQKVRDFFGPNLSGRTMALWGLAFKPNTDDIREAPALVMADALLAEGVHLKVFDPEAMDNVRAQYGERLTYAPSMYDALDGADCLLIATEWSEFRTPDFAQMKARLGQPVIFDGRNVYDLDVMREHGFYYVSIGRPVVDGRQ
ncbi:MAG: UDP-glucose/GDP-mannose dehydrogenase family protein [Saprospiraceae bacterium]|nr:UDP-glucose/GDP-mannose dehydrogenase family protein [Saprospiraceae bacterium]MDW8483224.1 UDP-glucose/GDP-mannose dehydrogenase family protein [Saprospiraceae bacterium]